MSYNHCQNPYCHYNNTTDRIRGSKGSKVYTTRNSTNYFGIACTLGCLNDYFAHNKEQIIRAIPERPKSSRPINTTYDWRRKKQDERQARLNSIKFKNSQS